MLYYTNTNAAGRCPRPQPDPAPPRSARVKHTIMATIIYYYYVVLFVVLLACIVIIAIINAPFKVWG